jgi:hypothetical protein
VHIPSGAEVGQFYICSMPPNQHIASCYVTVDDAVLFEKCHRRAQLCRHHHHYALSNFDRTIAVASVRGGATVRAAAPQEVTQVPVFHKFSAAEYWCSSGNPCQRCDDCGMAESIQQHGFEYQGLVCYNSRTADNQSAIAAGLDCHVNVTVGKGATKHDARLSSAELDSDFCCGSRHFQLFELQLKF